MVASFAVNMIFTKDSLWSVLVAAGVLSMWISLFFIIRNKNNIAKQYSGKLELLASFHLYGTDLWVGTAGLWIMSYHRHVFLQ